MDHLPLLLFIVFAYVVDTLSGVSGIGVNYGLLGNDLPPPTSVISLLKSRNIVKVRIFDPNPAVLQALQGGGMEVILGVRNEDLQPLANSPALATTWVNQNVVPYSNINFTVISAGNEVIPGELSPFVLPAMQNLDIALKQANIPMRVPVSTTLSMQAIGQSYPPSSGAFAIETLIFLGPIANFLQTTNSPLLLNVYPYFAYIGSPGEIPPDYVFFRESATPVVDGALVYRNLFDAMLDAAYAALEKVNAPNVPIIVSESGWPSAENGDMATIPNANTYINSLVAHVTTSSGTPRRPNLPIDAYIFAVFNENQKPPGTEQHFGLYYPNMNEVYHVNFP